MMSIRQRIRWIISERDSAPCCNVTYNYLGKARATRERIITNARHAVADSDGGQARATRERITSNARYAVGDGNGGQARATRERKTSNTRHAVYLSFIENIIRNLDVTRVFTFGHRCHLSLIVIFVQIIVQAILFNLSWCVPSGECL